jgi:hypothetical protein
MSTRITRLLGCRRNEDRASSVAGLIVQTALHEYSALREEVLQTFQRMVVAATLGLATAGAAASLALSRDLGWMESVVLLVASLVILLSTVGAISMSLHVATITRWLQHIASTQIRPVIAEAAKGLYTVPPDLLGWDDYQRNAKIHGLWERVLRRCVWLALTPLPITAFVFQLKALADLWPPQVHWPPQVQVPWCLMGVAVIVDIGVVIYSVLLLLQISAVRRAQFSAEGVVRP